MERRIGMRARTDFPVTLHNGMLTARCRVIEVSPSGIIVDRGHPVLVRDTPLVLSLVLRLPERLRPLRALARPIRNFGSQQALKFIRISDVDRLTLAEHLDLVRRRGRRPN
ncbi:MAG TPA: hypothetical protein VF989_09865 [Polyangiaceae bacterium]|jgi:hypothetical protein